MDVRKAQRHIHRAQQLLSLGFGNTYLDASGRTGHDHCSEGVVQQCHRDCWLVSVTTLLLKLPGIFNHLDAEIREWIMNIKDEVRPAGSTADCSLIEMPDRLYQLYKKSMTFYEQPIGRQNGPETGTLEVLRNGGDDALSMYKILTDRMSKKEVLQNGGDDAVLIKKILNMSTIDHALIECGTEDLMQEIRDVARTQKQVIFMSVGLNELGTQVHADDKPRKGEKAMTVEEVKAQLNTISDKYKWVEGLRSVLGSLTILAKKYIRVEVLVEALRSVLETHNLTLRGGTIRTAMHVMPFTICDDEYGTHDAIFCNYGQCRRNKVPFRDFWESVMLYNQPVLKVNMMIYGVDEFWDTSSTV